MGLLLLETGPQRAPSALEGTARRRSSVNREVGPHQARNLQAPWSWASRTVRKKSAVCKPSLPTHPPQSMIHCCGSQNRLAFRKLTLMGKLPMNQGRLGGEC